MSSGLLDDETESQISSSLYLQTKQISRNLSFYSSANNHFVSELMSMNVIGGMLGEKSWLEKSARLLEHSIDGQILSDGVGAEQSPTYQAQTAEYYIIYALHLTERSCLVPDVILRGLDRSATFLNAILDRNGYLPPFCDNDSGHALLLGESYSNYKTLLNLTAFVTGNDRHLRDDIGQDEKTFWLVGPDSFRSLVIKAERHDGYIVPKSFEKGGYYILENRVHNKDVRIIFDCGPLGMPPMAAHGHADALQFILYLNGCPIFIDPGTFTYFGDLFWRNYFRGTSAHNTVRIGGNDQSRFGGEFLVLHQARAECREWIEGESVTGVHYGYENLARPLRHERTICFDKQKGVIKIKDHLVTEGKHLIEIYFHLDSTCKIKPDSDTQFSILSPAGMLTLALTVGVESQIYFGDSVLPLGWQSRCYGQKEKTATLVGRKLISGSEIIITEIGV